MVNCCCGFLLGWCVGCCFWLVVEVGLEIIVGCSCCVWVVVYVGFFGDWCWVDWVIVDFGCFDVYEEVVVKVSIVGVLGVIEGFVLGFRELLCEDCCSY